MKITKLGAKSYEKTLPKTPQKQYLWCLYENLVQLSSDLRLTHYTGDGISCMSSKSNLNFPA